MGGVSEWVKYLLHTYVYVELGVGFQSPCVSAQFGHKMEGLIVTAYLLKVTHI
jgi:hypothetical protein